MINQFHTNEKLMNTQRKSKYFNDTEEITGYQPTLFHKINRNTNQVNTGMSSPKKMAQTFSRLQVNS